MSRLSDAFPKPAHRPCAVDRIRGDLAADDPESADDLDRWLADRAVSNGQIAKALRAIGFEIGTEAVRRYREKMR